MLRNGFAAYVTLTLCIGASQGWMWRSRQKRQGLGEGGERARTTLKPVLDLDEASGQNLIIDQLGFTRAPAVDFGDTPPPDSPKKQAALATPKPGGNVVTVQCPSCKGGTGVSTTAAPTTTYSGFLVGSPYPFALPPQDIPYFGSKWNGPWGLPVGHYQAFRGTGQYIPSYQYYPLSYFGSFLTPPRYALSGR